MGLPAPEGPQGCEWQGNSPSWQGPALGWHKAHSHGRDTPSSPGTVRTDGEMWGFWLSWVLFWNQ